MHRRTRLAVLFAAPLVLAGCGRNAPPPPPLKAPEVLVGLPLVKEVADYEIFTGRVEPSMRVDIRARVTGYLDKADFSEGAVVQEGDVLFVIDPRPYQAELAKAQATLAQTQARCERLERETSRAQPLVGRGAISREEFDRLLGDRDEARASIGVAESSVKLAQLNLRFTEVRAPFAGRISRRLVDPGNLVKADETMLTTLIALEPLYIYFDVDERTLLRQLLRAGQPDLTQRGRLPIEIGLSDETGFPHPGVINFVDNRADPNTGTMWMRGEFISPDRAEAVAVGGGVAVAVAREQLVNLNRPVKPGIFGRVRFPLGAPYEAVLVAEQALGTDQGQKFVYVVNDKNRAVYKEVKVGRLHDGLRVVREGLSPGERVVVTGLQRVRRDAEVAPKSVEMRGLVRRARAGGDDVAGPPAAAAGGRPPPQSPTGGLTPRRSPDQPESPRPDAKTEAGS